MNDFISADEALTIPGLVARRIDKSAEKTAYIEYDREKKLWRQHDWREVGGEISAARARIANEKLPRGERVGIWLGNSLAWVAHTHAALSLGLVAVPLYVADNPANVSWALADADCRLIVVESEKQLAACGWQGRAIVVNEKSGFFAAAPEAEGISPQDLAFLVYTSSTTGRAKGVMLSHRNLLWNADAVQKAVPAQAADLFLSILPLSHAFELTVGHLLSMMAGSTVAFSRGIGDLSADLRILCPTVLIFVPRIYERAREKLIGRSRLFARVEREAGCPPTVFSRLVRKFAARLVAAAFGGRVRVAVSGGAPLPVAVSEFFLYLGLPLIQGYGLTEASPVVSCNRIERNFPDSAGKPLPGVEVSIGREQELLVRSAGVMMGYWRQIDATASAVDAAGWLHTGDRAELSGEGIRILGRIMDILVLSTGVKISAADLEAAILRDSLFDNALVLGNGRARLAALLVLNPEKWREFSHSAGFRPEDANKAVLKRLETLLADCPAQARIAHVRLLFEPWTLENGLLTATGKTRRHAIERCFRDEIEAMYGN